MPEQDDFHVYTVRVDWIPQNETEKPNSWMRNSHRIVAPTAEKAIAEAMRIEQLDEIGEDATHCFYRLAEVIEGEEIDSIAL